MKVSLNWLREFVELPPTTEVLVELLTLAGVEVEEVIHRGVDVANVVVAQIRESVQHPNADRLSVCQVDDGAGVVRQIVCGAKNYRVGDKVPLALPGAVLPGDFKIKVGKLRGVESQGMLCSAKELALSEDAEGLLILAPDTRVGAPITELFPSDTILELEITPNRADLLSMNGIAREIGALTGKPVRLVVPQSAPLFAEESNIAVAADECPAYTARKISGITVAASPEWLRRKLEALGLRPINNVVDITNLVMMELGHPLHAFDGAKIHGALNVRLAQTGEELHALDGKRYQLHPRHLVIADANHPVAIAGVMGGEESGVTEATREVWLESARFLAPSVRRTSRELGLSSDSSYRFERGVDASAAPAASQRAAELILELCGGEMHRIESGFAPSRSNVVATVVFRDGDEESRRVLPRRPGRFFEPSKAGRDVRLRPERVARVLGAEIPEERIETILRSFGLKQFEPPPIPAIPPGTLGAEEIHAKLERARADLLEHNEPGSWEIPTFRQDLSREVDLIEEIARVIGMDAIPARVQARFAPASASDRAYDAAMELRRELVGQGLHEARSLTLVPAEPRGSALTQTASGTLQRVKNPMIDDQVVLRPNLMHGLFEALTRNIRAGEKSVRLFEIGRTFSTVAPEEFSHVAIVLSGPPAAPSWRGESRRDADLFDLKGIVAAALGRDVSFEPEENAALALSIAVKVAGAPVGLAGQLWPAEARALDATAPVLFAELDLAAVAQAAQGRAAKKYRDIPRFPTVTRDIALLAPLTLPHEKITATLTAAREPLLAAVELFDVFTDPNGAKIPADRRSLAYSLIYRSAERTLTSDEVNAAHARLKERLKNELAVTLRE